MRVSGKDKTKPSILAAETVARSRFFAIEQLHLRFTNGVERHYERMKGSGRGAVMVVPLFEDDHLLLIREYSAGTHSYELGFPKGLVDPGETILQAANRELKEEAGFGARELIPLKQVTLAPSYFGHRMDLLVARGLYPQKLEGDEPEPLEVIRWPLDALDDLLVREDFTEARSLAALFLACQWMETTV